MLPWRCGTDQEANLYPVAAWWAVHPELVLADTRCTGTHSAVPVAFHHPARHTVSPRPCVSGWDSPGLRNRRFSKSDGDAVNQHISLKC